MPPWRGRKKKLIVAFHFQFANQAAWNCDTCRRSGLETRRNCGWLPKGAVRTQNIVWARKGVVSTECPKSYITAQSLGWVEQFFTFKTLGIAPDDTWPATTIEAFLALDAELAKEKNA